MQAYQLAGGLDPNLTPGLNTEQVTPQGVVCDSEDDCPYTGADTPFMQALVDTEGLMGVFSGHNHGVEYV